MSEARPAARYLAEFAVIVIGVLVALLAESAWDERGERKEEAEALVRISEEVALDTSRISNAGLWLDFVIPSAERAAEILAGRDTLSSSKQLAVLYAASLVNSVGSGTTTWDELAGAGRTSLIRDADLRRGLNRYYVERTNFENRRGNLPDIYRATILGLLPRDYTRRVLADCVRATSGLNSAPLLDAFSAIINCPVVPTTDADLLLESVRARPDLTIEVGRLAYDLVGVREYLTRFHAEHDGLTAGLQERLSR